MLLLSQHIRKEKFGMSQDLSDTESVGEPDCFDYRQVSNIGRIQSQHLKYSRTVLWLFLPNPLKPDVKSRMKMSVGW